jgi:hypothetical protein
MIVTYFAGVSGSRNLRFAATLCFYKCDLVLIEALLESASPQFAVPLT